MIAGPINEDEDSESQRKPARRRKRKNGSQLQSLMKAFEHDPHWSKETLLMLSVKTGLTEAQVYKWGWD